MTRYSTLRNDNGHIVYHGTEPWTVDNGVYDCADTFSDSDNVFIGDMFVFGNDRDHATFVITEGKYANDYNKSMRQIVTELRDTYPEVFPIDIGMTPFIMVAIRDNKWVLIDDDRHGELELNAVYAMACIDYQPGWGDLEVVGEPVVIGDIESPIGDYVAAIKSVVQNNGWV